MARREVDIGIVGNDGTGDSIREAFRKVNDNFKELYAIFGQGDTISILQLGDIDIPQRNAGGNPITPLRPADDLTGYDNHIFMVNTTGNQFTLRELVGGDNIEIDAASDSSKVTINSSGTSLNDDFTPTLSGPLNANQFVIANLKEPSQTAVDQFNLLYQDDGVQITVNDIAITKGYADRYYIRKSGGSASGQIRVRNEPITASEYTLIISGYDGGDAIVTDHGFDSSIDGSAYVYNSTSSNATNLVGVIPVTNSQFQIGKYYRIETLGTTDFTDLGASKNKIGEIFECTDIAPIPGYGTVTTVTGGGPGDPVTETIDGGAPGTTTFTPLSGGSPTSVFDDTNIGTVRAVYFLKYVNENKLSFHTTFQDAQLGTNKISANSGSGLQTLTDAYYNSSLSGYWVSNEVLPRESVVRREGDTMSGILNLSDHPFPLNGAGTPNGPNDLQAATKYYVDNSSFASQVNLYVSTTGLDLQLDVPPGKEGRAWAYAYRTLSKACERAEYMMANAAYEPGPYRQLISFNDGQELSVVTGFTAPGIDGIGRVRFSNKAGQPVDQGNPLNTDITPGKIIKGRLSGASGFIYNYAKDNTSTIGEDYVDIQHVSGTFIQGENLEFGQAVKNLHITIHIESGIYEEDYPIKVPSNTAIVGDEFRRVLIRPRDRISQSPWVETWFFRNSVFDNLSLVQNTSDPDLLDSDLNGWYGSHYLKKPHKPINRGANYTNVGNFNDEANTILTNKAVIKQEIVDHINDLGDDLSELEEIKTKRDIGYIVDAIVYDLINGGMDKILELQDLYSTLSFDANCLSGLAHIDDYINSQIIPTANTDVKTVVTSMMNKLLFAFDSNFNTPKNNKDIDVFLCNDTTIIRQITCQGHGGFMMVLDPEGQILSKSPYCQQSGSFCAGINQQAFRGGQYIDGFSGNLTAQIVQKISNTRLKISEIPRAPQTPTSFFLSGSRYKVDSWVPHSGARPNAGYLLTSNKYFLQFQTFSYINIQFLGVKYPYADVEKLANKIIDALAFDVANGGNSKTLEATKRFFNPSDLTLKFDTITKNIILSMLEYIKESAKSIVTNDAITVNQNKLTQIIDATRGGETGSTIALENLMINLIDCINIGISEIDNLNYPSFELVLDPTTPLLSNPIEITLITPGNTSMLSNDFTQVNDLGYGIVTNNNGLSECVSVFSYYCWTSMFSNNGGQIRSLNGSSANGEYGLVAAGSDPLEIADQVTLLNNTIQVATIVKRNTSLGDFSTSSSQEDLFVYVDNFQYIPYNVSILEINHGFNDGVARYEINSSQVVGFDTISSKQIIKLNFNTSGNNETQSSGLATSLLEGQHVTIRCGQNFKFDNVLFTNPTRPSTALTFEGDPDLANAPVYRVINYTITSPDGSSLPANQAILTTDTTFEYVTLTVAYSYINENDNENPGKKLGALIGDTKIAINIVTTPAYIPRLNSGEMIFAWDGKIHRILSYHLETDYAYIKISDVDNSGNPLPFITNPGLGIASSFDSSNPLINPDNNIQLKAGLQAGELANITVRISTMRATGHDFLDVGTGSYNTTNYPSKIFGDPKTPNQANEVDERTRGRVFYVSTDQDGFFRVGRFFTVDQGTGTVSFAASIALTNLDGIGFKNGTFITSFSDDDGFTDLAQDAVPTEAATSGYIDRRLGLDRLGNIIPGPKLFSYGGFLDRKGILGPLNNIGWGGYQLKNLGTPVDGSDATTKSYVDIQSNKFNTLNKLQDTVTNSATSGQVATFIGLLNGMVHATVDGDLSATLGTTATSTLTAPIAATGALSGGAIEIVDASSFPSSGFVRIDNEIFQYNGKTSLTLTGVTRLSESTDPERKFKGVPAIHNFGATVSSLNTSFLNYQIKPDTIINSDVKSDAGIVQSKLALNAASTRANATGISQADLGVASFDTSNFEVTNGWVGIKAGGISRSELENVTVDRILGNLGGTATYPQEIEPSDLLKRATWNAIGSIGSNSTNYVFTFYKGPDQASSTFNSTEINALVTNNSIAKRSNDGSLRVSKINTNDDVSIIQASGNVDNATPVVYKGQWTPGANATFEATYATSAGSANNANYATNAGYATSAGSATTAGSITGQANSATITASVNGDPNTIVLRDGTGNFNLGTVAYATSAGSITGQANSATITATSTNTANTIVLRDASGNFSAGIITATATQAQYADLAEKYTADKVYEPGTVLVFGGSAETTTTNIFGDSKVAGVVSTDPAHLMNSKLEGITATIALQGRVPCKVIGKVKKGDLLTTAATPGHAIKAIDPKVGTIIGKSLEDKDTLESGIIEVAVGRF